MRDHYVKLIADILKDPRDLSRWEIRRHKERERERERERETEREMNELNTKRIFLKGISGYLKNGEIPYQVRCCLIVKILMDVCVRILKETLKVASASSEFRVQSLNSAFDCPMNIKSSTFRPVYFPLPADERVR